MNELRWILLGIGIVLLALIYVFARRSSGDDNALPDQDARYEPSLSADSSYDDTQFDTRFDEASEETTRSAGHEEGFREEAVLSLTSASRFDSPDMTRPAGISDSRFSQAPALGALDDEASQTNPGSVAPEEEVADTAPSTDNAVTPPVPEKVIALHLMPKAGQMFAGIDFIGAVQAEGLQFGRFDIFHRFANSETVGESTPSQFSLANMIKPGTFNLHDLESQEFKGASLFLVLPGPEDAVAAFADMVATGRRLAATLDGQLLDAQGTALSRQSASHLREDIINYQHGLSAAPAE